MRNQDEQNRMQHGLAIYTILLIVFTPIAICIRGGIGAVIFAWIMWGCVFYGVVVLRIKDEKRWRDNYERDKYYEDHKDEINQRTAEQEDLFTTPKKLEVLLQPFGFELVTHRYDAMGSGMFTIETHKSIDELHKMHIYSPVDILGNRMLAFKPTTFEPKIDKKLNERLENELFLDYNNIILSLDYNGIKGDILAKDNNVEDGYIVQIDRIDHYIYNTETLESHVEYTYYIYRKGNVQIKHSLEELTDNEKEFIIIGNNEWGQDTLKPSHVARNMRLLNIRSSCLTGDTFYLNWSSLVGWKDYEMTLLK